MDMMSGMTATASDASSAATSMAMSDMDMGGMHGDSNSCKISVGLNRVATNTRLTTSRCFGTGTLSMPVSDDWKSLDLNANPGPGFISSQWQITSPGMFAGSCIGVICLVMSLAFLRRLHRTYDAAIIRSLRASSEKSRPSGRESLIYGSESYLNDSLEDSKEDAPAVGSSRATAHSPLLSLRSTRTAIRPTLLQQTVRALLHMVEFTVAYFVMLLAMYFNGYIIICIFIGSFLGYFVFEWDSFQRCVRFPEFASLYTPQPSFHDTRL